MPTVTQLATRKNVTEALFVGQDRLKWNMSFGGASAPLACLDPSLTMTLQLGCSYEETSAAAAVDDVSLHYTMQVWTRLACVENVDRDPARVMSPLEIGLTAAAAALVTALCYSVGHRYFVQRRRGMDVLPGVSRRQYLPREDGDAGVEVN